MKKIRWFAFAAFCVFALSACKEAKPEDVTQTEEAKPKHMSQIKGAGQDYFNAVILEVYDEYIIVECSEVTSGYVHEGDKAKVSKDVVFSRGIPKLVVGDEVRVLFSGLEETEPLKLKTVFAIYPLDEEGKSVFDFEPETVPLPAVDADINMYNYRIAEGISDAGEENGDMIICRPHFSLTIEDGRIKGTITVITSAGVCVYNIEASSSISVGGGKDNVFIAHAKYDGEVEDKLQFDSRIYMHIDDQLEAFYVRLADDACFVGPANDAAEAKALYEKLGLYSVEGSDAGN
ncbi:MAG: hypothetical protein IJW18_06835 [Lachnospiraceae bacterium]|nr:hypothetical protein [Lachnospiraceae bacterium]